MIAKIKSLTVAAVCGVILAGAASSNAQGYPNKPLPVAQSDYTKASRALSSAKKAQSSAQAAYNKKKTAANLSKLNAAKKKTASANTNFRKAKSTLAASNTKVSQLNAALSAIVRDTSNQTEDPNFPAISSTLDQIVYLNPGSARVYFDTALTKLGYFNPRTNATTLLASVQARVNASTFLPSASRAQINSQVQIARLGFTPADPNNGYQASVAIPVVDSAS